MRKKQSEKVNIPNIDDIARAAAREALKLQKDEERQRIRKNRFHNTELLLKNYLSLVEHFQNSIDCVLDIKDDLELFDFDKFDSDDFIIQAIRRSKVRTKIMISQIDTCLEILRVKMRAKGQSEKCNVIWRLYLEPELDNMTWKEKVEAVAAELHCGEASVYRWRNEMINELSVFLFGIDGLQLDI